MFAPQHILCRVQNLKQVVSFQVDQAGDQVRDLSKKFQEAVELLMRLYNVLERLAADAWYEPDDDKSLSFRVAEVTANRDECTRLNELLTVTKEKVTAPELVCCLV